MKTVILALKNGMAMARFLSLAERLQVQGIAVQAYLAEEELPQRDDALYITDCAEVAEDLKKCALPVLGFAHEAGDSLWQTDYIMEAPEDIDTEYLERVYRRHRGIPWDILETERCIIRESTVEDVDAFFAIYEDENIVKYTDALYAQVEQEKAYMRQYIDKIYRYYEFGIWTVVAKDTGEIIGRAGFVVRDGYELPDMGFVIATGWQQKGIAFEICNALLYYGKHVYEFDGVQALVMPENTASLQLCKKLGFVVQKTVLEQGKEYLYLTKEL